MNTTSLVGASLPEMLEDARIEADPEVLAGDPAVAELRHEVGERSQDEIERGEVPPGGRPARDLADKEVRSRA